MPVRHFVSLDGWRGAAALIVALFHFSTAAQLSSTAFIRNSWLLVDFFFVLSGFVIAANYRERLAQGFAIDRFMLLRLGRLYPLHAVMLAAFVATELMLVLLSGHIAAGSGRAYFEGRTSIVGIVKSLFLVQGLGSEDDIAWNGVSWSVATEIWA